MPQKMRIDRALGESEVQPRHKRLLAGGQKQIWETDFVTGLSTRLRVG